MPELTTSEISVCIPTNERREFVWAMSKGSFRTRHGHVILTSRFPRSVRITGVVLHYFSACIPDSVHILSLEDTSSKWRRVPWECSPVSSSDSGNSVVRMYEFRPIMSESLRIELLRDTAHEGHYRLGLFSVQFLGTCEHPQLSPQLNVLRSSKSSSPWLGIPRVFEFPSTSSLFPLLLQSDRSPWLQASAKERLSRS